MLGSSDIFIILFLLFILHMNLCPPLSFVHSGVLCLVCHSHSNTHYLKKTPNTRMESSARRRLPHCFFLPLQHVNLSPHLYPLDRPVTVSNNLFFYINVNILGSDSTPPPVSKMSPVSNKFEGIPQQQRYRNMTSPVVVSK